MLGSTCVLAHSVQLSIREALISSKVSRSYPLGFIVAYNPQSDRGDCSVCPEPSMSRPSFGQRPLTRYALSVNLQCALGFARADVSSDPAAITWLVWRMLSIAGV